MGAVYGTRIVNQSETYRFITGESVDLGAMGVTIVGRRPSAPSQLMTSFSYTLVSDTAPSAHTTHFARCRMACGVGYLAELSTAASERSWARSPPQDPLRRWAQALRIVRLGDGPGRCEPG